MASKKKTAKKAAARKKQKQKRDVVLFSRLKRIAVRKRMRQLTKVAIQKINKAIGLKKPDVLRTVDIEDKAAFIAGVGTMVVNLYTGFNLLKKEFNPNGSLEIVISQLVGNKNNTKRVFVRRFKRERGAGEKVKQYLAYILKEISEEKRPQTKKGNWASIKEITQDQYYWVDEKERIIRGFFDNAPADSLVRKIQEQREKYDIVTRPKKGFKKRRREIKKSYTTKN